MKKYRVMITRTLTVECSMVVSAKNQVDACDKVTKMGNEGKLGEARVTFREYGKRVDVKGLEVEDSPRDHIEVEYADAEEE